MCRAHGKLDIKMWLRRDDVLQLVIKRLPFPNKRGAPDGHRAEIQKALVGALVVVVTPLLNASLSLGLHLLICKMSVSGLSHSACNLCLMEPFKNRGAPQMGGL